MLDTMTLAQRVGQLFMVDCPTTYAAQATLDDISQYGVGTIILDGTSQLSVTATAAVTAQLQRRAAAGVRLFISTDQEGGEVQRLRGPGFSTIPSAVEQGTEPVSTLRSAAQLWGSQLRQAGVGVDLGPVLDTVPANSAGNPPIGDLDREYGRTPSVVTAHGLAVAQGLAAAGVDATAKHFPGLGRVSGNTDLSAGVRDTVTTSTDPYLAPFIAAINQHIAFMMMSTAIYTRIDPTQPAAFSPAIVSGLLRQRLGFQGVIVSDDLGGAAQVSGYSVGARAVAFLAAGGDMVLTVVASQIAEMTAAVIARAGVDSGFRAQVDAAALVVLTAKQNEGLLG
ncbi:MAG: glycoside hydrolase family 3 protein [Actinomycetota bacterium]|nr:glycoside hydrolase family 3 protein [Actinomycetota bacterium]